MAELGEATLSVGVKSVNLDREQAARAEAILIADFALRTKDGSENDACWNDECSLPSGHDGKHRPYMLPAGRPFTVNGSKPAAAIDLMTVADYIVAGFAEEDPGPYEFVFTSDQPEDGRSDDEREDDEF